MRWTQAVEILGYQLVFTVIITSICTAQLTFATLYCGLGDSFYEVGKSWNHRCYRYSCTSEGLTSEPIYNCPAVVSWSSPRCSPVVETTDQQACCTEETFCEELILPPHGAGEQSAEYVCPEEWTVVPLAGRDGNSSTVCMKTYTDRLPYAEAEKVCRQNGAFLVNLETPGLIRTVLGERELRESLFSDFIGTEAVFWTGSHLEGPTFVWDGLELVRPQLKYFCPSKQPAFNLTQDAVPYSAWGCNYERMWAELKKDPCIAAKVNSIGLSSGESVEMTELVLSGCEDEHQFICAGEFTDLETFQLSVNKICEEGWMWNPLSKVCIMYVDSDRASSNYFTATEDCKNKGGALYAMDNKERQFLLYEVMKSQKVKPHSVWISEECVMVLNPYIAGTPDLNSTRQLSNCYVSMPYICEKPPKPIGDFQERATLEIDSGGMQCLLDDKLSTKAVIVDQNGDLFPADRHNLLTEVTTLGAYQCLVWSEATSQYLLSNLISTDIDEAHIFVVTVALPDIPFRGWHKMAEYYSFTEVNDLLSLKAIEEAYLNVVEPAFEHSRSMMRASENCTTCSGSAGENSSVYLYLSKIASISAGKIKGIKVTGLLGIRIDHAARETREVKPNANKDSLLSNMEMSFREVLSQAPGQAEVVRVTQLGQCPQLKMYVGNLRVSLSLPSVMVYEKINMSLCVDMGEPLVAAICERGAGGGGVWNISINACEKETLTEASQELRTLSLISINSSNCISILNQTATLIDAKASPADVVYVSVILTNALAVPLNTPRLIKKYFSQFIEVIQRLLDVEGETIDAAQAKAQSSTRILAALDMLSTCPITPELVVEANICEIVRPNIAYRLTTQTEISGVMLLKKKISWSTITYANKSEEVTPINNNKIVGFFLKDLEIDGGIRKAFTVFGNKKLHKSSEKLKSVDQIVAGSMMMADGRPLEFSHSYNDLVSIHYPETANSLEKSKDLSKVQCGFWATGQTVWATDGCVTVFDDVNGVSCSCNHLTDFSVLLDISGSENAQDPQLEKHNKILSTISLIGLSVSIVSLSFVIFTALLYKQFRKTNSQKVLALLAMCLLARDVTFIAGIQQTGSYEGCVAVAIVLHYLTLASFAWMFVEAIIQYLRFVKVFNTYIPKFMLKTSLPAFAAPLIIVAITIAVDIDLYKGSDLYCWMKPEAIYYAMMLPIGLVLFFNLIIFIRVLCALVVAKRNSNKIRSNQSSREKEILYLLAAIGVFAVLGLSWIFGYLTIVTSASIAFRYLFSIFSTIQGLLIFLCHNIREPNIRKEWTTALTCKWGKKAGEKRVNLAKSPTETESSNETRLSNLSNYKT